jgi:hypothetical protein
MPKPLDKLQLMLYSLRIDSSTRKERGTAMTDRKSEQFGTFVTLKEERAPRRAIEWSVRRWSNVDAPRVVAGPFRSLAEAQAEVQRRMDARR